MPSSLDRRSFLAAAGAAMAGARTARAAAPTSSTGGRIRLGAPLSVPGDDPDALARAHRARGYRAAYCPDIRLDDRERIRATVEAFARHDVVIAEVGRWVNLLDPDPAARRKNLATVTDGLALAEAVGAAAAWTSRGPSARRAGSARTPTTSRSASSTPRSRTRRKILDAVKPRRTTFCYEMMAGRSRTAPTPACAC